MHAALFFLIPIIIAAVPTSVGTSIKETLVANTPDTHTHTSISHIPASTLSPAIWARQRKSAGITIPAISPLPCHVLVMAKVSEV
jgi:hypothetical protein